eukprot:CAMPEP_0176127402 /NCGR_PEP_ID=MMETSP0120_2-20121206/64342_1 /TAXON_ID=160619 /ORGANISM="Kryptoperidinium foliaceum, Strain CCMP 1326" /LENGTH=78 /DNA_ID=CAMNT_0017462417 /DNA_START=61 /DNA_END=294 /DNA_ORIENTATION=+
MQPPPSSLQQGARHAEGVMAHRARGLEFHVQPSGDAARGGSAVPCWRMAATWDTSPQKAPKATARADRDNTTERGMAR